MGKRLLSDGDNIQCQGLTPEFACNINQENDDTNYDDGSNNEDSGGGEDNENLYISEIKNYSINITATLQLGKHIIDPGEPLDFNISIQNKSEQNYSFEIIVIQEKNTKIYYEDSIIVDYNNELNKNYSIDTNGWPATNSPEGSNYKIFIFGKSINDNGTKNIYFEESFNIIDKKYTGLEKSVIFGQVFDSYGNAISGAVVYLFELGKKDRDFENKKCKCTRKNTGLSGMLGILEYIFGSEENINPKSIFYTDKDGFYSFDVKGENFKIIVQSENYETKLENEITFGEDNIRRIDFHLRKGELLKGKVINNLGIPIENSIVALELNGGIIKLKTNEEGLFQLYLFGKKFYKIYVADHKLEYFDVKEVKPPKELSIIINNHIKTGKEIEGYVSDAYSGKSISGTKVLMYSRGITSSIIMETARNKDGYYKIKTISNNGLIFADAVGYSIEKKDVSFENNSKIDVNFQLHKGSIIVGRVTDKNSGENINNASIIVSGEDLFEYEKKLELTDENGYYIIEGVESFDKIIMAKAEGYGFVYKKISVQSETALSANMDETLAPLEITVA